MAASWLDPLSPPKIVKELERSRGFLEAQWSDLPNRQQSLRAVIHSSFHQLDELGAE